jgi:hypothetical protein
MANQTRGNSGFPNFFGDRDGADARKQFIDGSLEGARGAAIGTLMEVAGLLTVLPNAAVASQQRELERLKATRGDDDPRVVQLEASLARAATLSAMGERGQARFQRAAVALADSEDVFHGFVSNGDLDPLPNLTVRIGKQYSATTDADGYFRIPLGTKTGGTWSVRDMLKGATRGAAKVNAEASTEPVPGEVEIVQKGTVVYTDPAPLPLDRGRVYREYVIPREPATPRDFRNFLAKNAAAEAPEGKRSKRKR